MSGRKLLPALLLAGLLTLTGCFRQAGDDFQPVTAGGASGQSVQPSPSALFVEVTPQTPLPFVETSPTVEGEATEEITAPTGDFLLPTDDLAATAVVEPTSDTGERAAETPEAVDSQPTAETIAPTTDSGSQPMIVTVAVTNTPEIVPTEAPPTTDPAAGAPTSEFITPGAPSNPNAVIITNTPMPDVPPTNTPSGLITPTSLFEDLEANCIYMVRGGDSLYRIAINNNTSVSALRAANPQLSGDLIRPGQQLRLPDCESTTDNAGGLTPAPTEIIAPTTPGNVIEYVVRPGDTLYNIALRNGVTVRQIIDLNELVNPDRLSIGQRLLLPQP